MGAVEPFFLGRVGGEGLAFEGVDGSGVDESVRDHGIAEGIAEAVGHGVVEEDVVAVVVGRRRVGDEVRRAVGEGGGDGEAAGGHMVFHVIGGRVGEDDGRFHLADDAGDFAEEGEGVEYLEVIGDGRVEGGAEEVGGFFGFGEAGGACLIGIHDSGAGVTGGEVHVVDIEAGVFFEEEEGAGSDVFDIVGVGEDGEGGFAEGHEFGPQITQITQMMGIGNLRVRK